MNINVITLSKMQTFLEYSNALKMSLEELGHNVTLTTNKENTSDVNIFTQSFQPYVPTNKGINILYQCEELWGQKDNYRVGNGYSYVLEMYKEQYKDMKKFGMNVYYCPYGYSPAYETNLPEVDEDIDILFFGAYTQYRREWMEKIKLHSLMKDKVIVHTDKSNGKLFFGIERDRLIMRSKIIINFRAHNEWMYASLRGLLTQCKKKLYLVEEPSGGCDPYKRNKHFERFRNIDEFIEKSLFFLNNDKERNKFAVSAYEDIKKNHKWSKYLDISLKDMKIC